MANITLRCAGERLNEIISKHFSDHLTLGELGGIKWYLSRDNMEELMEQLEFAIEHTGTKSLDLVSHTDCGLYKELGEDHTEQYAEDLHQAISQIQERFPELRVRGHIYHIDTKRLEHLDNEE